MNNKFDPKKFWIGFVRVKQNNRNGVLGDADQAFTNVIGLAKNKADFRLQVKRVLETLELQLLRLEDVELLEQRLSKHSVHKDILALVDDVKKDGQIAFDVFATFDGE